MLIDLNARRAARAAKRKEPVMVQVGDLTFEMAPQVKLRALELVADNDITGAAKLLLAHPERDWEAFAAEVDMNELSDILSSYGSSLGESSASTDSSASTGEPSGLTSDASTDSTSPTPVSETPPST